MTAEIALLNKSAVALAADSAATVSSGKQQEKVFNSEDKLFELSNTQPIGVMIFNSTTFLGTPVHILIKKYRSLNKVFKNVDEAAIDFRNYLRDFARSLSSEVREKDFSRLTRYPADLVQTRVNEEIKKLLNRRMADKSDPCDFLKVTSEEFPVQEIYLECVEFYAAVFKRAGPASVTGSTPVQKGKAKVTRTSSSFPKKLAVALTRLLDTFLKSAATSPGSTGFVIAGFGREELFPSLRSFEIDGMLGDELRFMNCDNHDITLEKSSAKVLPFAQQDMVDRFVSGIDEKSQSDIEKFCRERLSVLHAELINVLGVEDAQEEAMLRDLLNKADQEYMRGLVEDGFAPIKQKSRDEMEGMVEFMPKSELAQMAESLVELTSIKRRVSRGFETVGGPIDVAVISRSDGFVWIKRKHYFPSELNARFFDRVSSSIRAGGLASGDDEHNAPIGQGTGSAPARSAGDRGSSESASSQDVVQPESAPRPIRRRKRKTTQSDH